MYTKAAERFRSRVLLAPQATGTGAQAYLAPTPGTMGIVFRAAVKMGNAADLVLSLKYADDATGTNATAYPVSAPIFRDGAAVTPAVTYTVDDATGNYVVEFCIDPATIPTGKFVGVSYANSNAANFLSVVMQEDIAYKPYA